MHLKHSDYIHRNYTYSDRAKRKKLNRRRRKQLLIRRCFLFALAIILLLIIGITVVSVKHKFVPKQSSTEKKEKKQIQVTPIPDGATTLSAESLTSLNSMAFNDERVAEIVNHYEQYPDDLLELLSKNTETTEFVLNYPKNKDKPCSDTVGTVTKGTIPHLLQWDSRWGYGVYVDNFIAINGCGPTSLAMVVTGLTGNNTITPYKIAQYAAANNLYIPESGSSWDLMRIGTQQYGITSQEVMLDESAMKKHLSSGHPIICSMRPGDFTTTGHFIVLTSYKDGNFQILDANSIENSEKLWSYEQLSPQINNLWAFSL